MAIKKSSPAAKAVSAIREAVAPVKAVAAAVKPPQARKKLSSDELFGMIRDKAYELYVQRGCSAGDSLDDWYKAEVLVKKEQGL